jgi:hypothetical protein
MLTATNKIADKNSFFKLLTDNKADALVTRPLQIVELQLFNICLVLVCIYFTNIVYSKTSAIL